MANGSRIIRLPGEEGSVRCFNGVALLVVDEAAKVPDSLHLTVRPMLAVSKGRLIVMSTPFGKRGFFFEAWHSAQKWKRIKITAAQCPRIEPEFLAEERLALGPRWYALAASETCQRSIAVAPPMVVKDVLKIVKVIGRFLLMIEILGLIEAHN